MYKESIEKLVAQVLERTQLQLKVDSYTLEEKLETGEVDIRAEVHDERTGEKQVIQGKGVGMVDAFFHGLLEAYSQQFPSLNTIRFCDFSIQANVDTGRAANRSDMAAQVTLRIANSEGHEYSFAHSSPSITRSSINVVLDGAEFFINSERAFIQIYRALQHAREARRPDSVELYTRQLATLVEATSYSDVIEQIKEDLKGKA